MKKQTSRRIPYRVYKKVFSDCPASQYENGTILVEFPQEYLDDKIYTPNGWLRFGNSIAKPSVGDYDYRIDIIWGTDSGVRSYDVHCKGRFVPSKSKKHFYSLQSAINWALEISQKAKENVAIMII